MDEVEEGTHPPMDSCGQSDAVSQLDRVTCELREDLERDRGRRLDLIGNVDRLIERRKGHSMPLTSWRMSGNSVLSATS